MPYGERSWIGRLQDALHAFAVKRRSIPGLRGLTGQVVLATWMTLRVAAHPLSSGHRVSAVVRFWSWQLWRRLVNRPVLVQFTCRAKLLCPPWSEIAGSWVSMGYHEEELVFALAFLRPGDTLIDVGANIGVYSMAAAAAGAGVVAFEPVGDARFVFETNARLNHASERIKLLPFALADFDGTAQMTSGLESSNRFLREGETGASAPVAVRTLDSLTTDLDLGRGKVVLKVDAEGSDEAVLRGARSLLSTAHPAVIVEVWCGGPGVRRLLEALGYQMYHYDSLTRRLEAIPQSFNGQGYFVAIHRDELALTEERLATAAARPQERLAPTILWRPPAEEGDWLNRVCAHPTMRRGPSLLGKR